MTYKPQIEKGEMGIYLGSTPGLNYLEQEAKRLADEAGVSQEEMLSVALAVFTGGDGAAIAEKLKKLPKD